MPLISIKNNIASRRGDMTQRELAHKVGIGQTWVSMIETGKVIPTADELNAICAALMCSPTDLYDDKWLSVIGIGERRATPVTVKIPPSLVERVNERLDGYADVEDFVLDAVRRRCFL